MKLRYIRTYLWENPTNLPTPVDIGNLCVHCRQDTSFGSGRFVNRYPVFGFENTDTEQEEDGYCCDECEQGGDRCLST